MIPEPKKSETFEVKRTIASLLCAVFLTTATTWLPAQEGPSTAKAKLDALEKAYKESMATWQKEERAKIGSWKEAAKKAKADGKDVPSMPAMRMTPPKAIIAKHVKTAQANALEYAGTDDAIPFHLWALRYGSRIHDKEAVIAAADALTSTHIKSSKLEEVPLTLSYMGRLIGQDKAEAYIHKIEMNSPHADVRARAILARVTNALQEKSVDSMAYKGAKEEALRAAGMATSAAIKAEVKGLIDGRENLVMGKVAPDIVGVDLDSTAFKLSDYKGKIVMLDFWGDW